MLSPLATINSPARNRRQTTSRQAKNRRNDEARPKTGHLIRTGFVSPYLVRITRWIE
jgi:hypothetical protein